MALDIFNLVRSSSSSSSKIAVGYVGSRSRNDGARVENILADTAQMF